jgi:hypothetical protein
MEYDYYVNQFNDSAQQNINEIELGDLECLVEDDLFNETWLVAGKKFPNLIDYFYEAEVTNLCQTRARVFYTDSRDSLSEHEYNNYSKYRCYQGELGFLFCSKECCNECCNECTHTDTKKVVNEQYVLWEKYVQPIELV